MLILVSLGLFDEKDLTLRGLEDAKKAGKIYMELYTSRWHGSIKNLEKMVGKKIDVLKRKDLEEDSEKILKQAKDEDVVLFVQGDCFVQTTHLALIQEAKRLGIKAKVVHNASIVSAVAETGLHPQKFGPYVTIPFPEKTKGKLPESVYEIIKMNKSRGLHTLCLLDVVEEEDKYLTPSEAMKILLEIEGKRKENVFTNETAAVVFAKAGSRSPFIAYDKVKNLVKKDFKELPAVLVIPGILHFTEKEFLMS